MTQIKDFFLKFFNHLECDINEEGDKISVRNVPINFEKFSGKKSPYFFSFEKEFQGYDFVTPNHYLLKSMKEFLEGRGETTLLKMESNFNPIEDLPKLIPFRNSKIKNISKRTSNGVLFRFSFSSVFQYLNDREQEINNVYIKNGKIISFDESLSLIEGIKRDVQEIDFSNEYDIAKTKLKELVSPKIFEIKEKLNLLLKNEISRIKLHYENNIDEINKQKESLSKQISESDGDRLNKLNKMLKKFNEENSLDKFKEEEKLFIQHEIKKHGLSVKNKLLNVSVIYYPVYDLALTLRTQDRDKMINLEYDSYNKKISDLFCSSCNSKVEEIIICSSGHLTCRNCGDKCEVCDGIFCESCDKKVCSFCYRKICSSCETSCEKCKKTFCKNHTQEMSEGKRICRDCIERCSVCREVIEPNNGREESGKLFCVKCFAKERGKNILKDVFRN